MNAKPTLFVTGGSRGIGRAIVLLAVKRGYDAVFTYQSNKVAADELVKEVEAAGGKALGVKAEVGSREQLAAAFEAGWQKFGRLDALVTNAGVVGEPRSILDAEAGHLESVFRINVFGVFYAIAEAVKRMSVLHGGKGGAIVNMGSAASRHGGMVNEAHYASSKGAIDSLTLALAKELPQHGVRINTLRPGVIETSIHEIHGGEELFRKVASMIPLGRIGQAEEVAEAVLFLLGSQSSYVHGATLDIAGGR